MKDTKDKEEKEFKEFFKYMKKNNGCYRGAGGCGAVYGLGFIGSLIYFISVADSFWIGVLGILKAIVWPAFLVYEAFNFLLK